MSSPDAPAAALPGPPIALAGARAGSVGRPGIWLAAISLPWLVLWLLPPLNHDVSALLLFTDRWLDGAELYRDLVDVNPPLVFLLYAVPQQLARVAGMPPAASFLACFAAFVGMIGWLAAARLQALGVGPARSIMLWAILPFTVAGLGAGMEGQREQLLILAAFPWLLDAARRATGRRAWRETVPVALLAAIGFCLKPHFLLIPALVEFWLLLRRGPAALRDPVPWCLLATVLAYGALIALAFPAYLTDMLPLVLGAYSAFGEHTAADILFSRDLAPSLLVLAACLPGVRRSRDPVAVALALAALGAVFGAVAQAKGWPYHRLPAEMLIVLLVGWQGFGWLEGLGAPAVASAPKLAAALLVAANAFAFTTREGPWRAWEEARGPVPELVAILHAHAAGRPVLALTPGVDPVYPALLRAGAYQAMRYMTLWPLQVVYADCPRSGARYRDIARMGAVEQRVFEGVVEDFLRQRPAVVLVDRFADTVPCAGQEFDFLAYFQRDPRFAEAFTDYRKVAEIDRFSIFTRVD
jgi:hypothetical protein